MTLLAYCWGRDGIAVRNANGLPNIDLGIAQLEPFDPDWVARYPVFKDPSKDVHTCTSLCKLGYPFFSVEPTWHEAGGYFELPSGTLPLAIFPLEAFLPVWQPSPMGANHILSNLSRPVRLALEAKAVDRRLI
jgi:hypothetical protein